MRESKKIDGGDLGLASREHMQGYGSYLTRSEYQQRQWPKEHTRGHDGLQQRGNEQESCADFRQSKEIFHLAIIT